MKIRVYQPRPPRGTWMLEWRTPLRKVVRMAGFPSRENSERLARRIEALAYASETGEEMDARLLRWARDDVSDRIRRRLVELGIIPSSLLVSAKSLEEHLNDWEHAKYQQRRKKSTTRMATSLPVNRVRRMVRECGFRAYGDLLRGETVFLAWREEQRAGDAESGDDGLSHQTMNHVLASTREFCAWMVKQQRAGSIALAGVAKLDVDEDRRLERRSITAPEFQRLLDASWTRQEADHGLTGPERAALWWFVAETGLRLNEVKHVRPVDIQIESAGRAVVELSGKFTKNGDKLFQVVASAGLVGMLRDLAGMKAPTARLWRVSKLTRLALKNDLEAAGIPWQDQRGRQFDFHALRYQFGDRLFESGAPLNVIQKAMRHSTIELTAKRYAQARDDQVTRAMDGMQQFRRPGAPEQPKAADSTGATSGNAG